MFKLTTTFPSWGSDKNINKTLQNLNIIYLDTHTHIIIQCAEWWERYMSKIYNIYKYCLSFQPLCSIRYHCIITTHVVSQSHI